MKEKEVEPDLLKTQIRLFMVDPQTLPLGDKIITLGPMVQVSLLD